jgi:hypothetical protein
LVKLDFTLVIKYPRHTLSFPYIHPILKNVTITHKRRYILDPSNAFLVELMPEWKGIDLRVDVLTGGITNKLYKVQLPDGEAYVVRRSRTKIS